MMKLIVLAALIQFLCAKAITNATREAIEEKIKRLMANGEYRSTTLEYSLQISVDGDSHSCKYAAAEATCSHRGGRILSLNSQRKFDYYKGQAVAWHWIGARRESYQDKFKWLTGELVEPSNLAWREPQTPDALTTEALAGQSDITMNPYDPEYNSGTACEYDEWQHTKSYFNTINYKTTFVVVPGSKTPEEAASKCQMFDGVLATPSSFRELDAIDALMDTLGLDQVWLGAKRDEDKIYQPATWSTGFKIVKNLRPMYAEDGGECLYYNKSGGYFDFWQCTGGSYTACQIDH